MFARVSMCAFLLTLCVSCAERLGVSVCNFAHVPRTVLDRAEEDVGCIFGSFGVEITWVECPQVWTADDLCKPTRLILFIRPEPPTRGWMGRSFVANGDSGIYATSITTS